MLALQKVPPEHPPPLFWTCVGPRSVLWLTMLREIIQTENPARQVVMDRDAGLTHIYTTHNGEGQSWNSIKLEDSEACAVADMIRNHFPTEVVHIRYLTGAFWLSVGVNIVLCISLLFLLL